MGGVRRAVAAAVAIAVGAGVALAAGIANAGPASNATKRALLIGISDYRPPTVTTYG